MCHPSLKVYKYESMNFQRWSTTRDRELCQTIFFVVFGKHYDNGHVHQHASPAQTYSDKGPAAWPLSCPCAS